jgi:hypothetical protein
MAFDIATPLRGSSPQRSGKLRMNRGPRTRAATAHTTQPVRGFVAEDRILADRGKHPPSTFCDPHCPEKVHRIPERFRKWLVRVMRNVAKTPDSGIHESRFRARLRAMHSAQLVVTAIVTNPNSHTISLSHPHPPPLVHKPSSLNHKPSTGTPPPRPLHHPHLLSDRRRNCHEQDSRLVADAASIRGSRHRPPTLAASATI